MNEREQENRIEALGCAARHRIKEENADDIVKSAQKYFNFLQGEPDEPTSSG